MTELNLHPFCAIFPAMSETELAELAADIKANGLREPITKMPDGSTLDGRNRELACARAGVVPQYVVYDGGDPLGLVASRNLKRRHLSHAQRALIAAEIANLKQGRIDNVTKSVITGFVTQDEAARLMDVSKTAVQDARALQMHAADSVITLVKSGKVGLQTAAIVVRDIKDKAQQEKWTPADIKCLANAKKEGISKPPAANKPRRPSLGQQLEERAKRLQFRQLSDEEAGRPSAEIANEEDPDYPGMDRAYAHVLKHGRVQLWSPDETERLKLRGTFLELNAHISALGRRSWPRGEDVDRLGPEDAARVRGIWRKHLRAAHALLSSCLAALAVRAADANPRSGEPWCGPDGRFWESREEAVKFSGVVGFGEAISQEDD